MTRNVSLSTRVVFLRARVDLALDFHVQRLFMLTWHRDSSSSSVKREREREREREEGSEEIAGVRGVIVLTIIRRRV